tara:strand:+ start:587 stop:1699 length:1113 start_codon:yes stop_codon:yes gene_type:complete
MKKQQKILIVCFLLSANLCLGQDISTEENSINQTDTDSISTLNPYIEDHTNRLNINMIVSNNQLEYVFPYNDKAASVKTNLSLSYGFRFSYKAFSVRLRYRPKLSASDQENKGKTDHFRFGFDILLDKWAHFYEYDYRRGYYIDNTEFITGQEPSDFRIQFPSLTTNTFNGVSQYKFNKNYSIRAIESNTEIQLKSAGTFMPGINYTYYTFKGANKEILGSETEITERNPYNEYKGLTLIIEPGYYYTYVLNNYWYANVFAAPGFGVDFYNNKEINTDSNVTNDENLSRKFFSFKTGTSIGYNGKKFYFGSELKYHAYSENFDKNEISLQPSKIIFQVFLGYRFKAPKQVSKPLDYIEDKVPALKKENKN